MQQNAVKQGLPQDASQKATVTHGRAEASTLGGQPSSASLVALDKTAVLDQVYEDYCRLRDSGESVDPIEFASRYSQYQRSIMMMLDVHQFIERNPDLLNEAPEEEWPQLGEDYLGFELLDELGEGTFARVFLAAEKDLGNRLVAVKIAADNEDEAQTIARLRHRNIVPVHSVRPDPRNNRTLICMPYMGRATLCDLLDRIVESGVPQSAQEVLSKVLQTDERFPVTELTEVDTPPVKSYIRYVLWLGAALADALAETHKSNICHGDLKPSNVLLVGTGRPMLVDFNLSLDMGDASRLGGTLPYIAPEQLQALVAVRNGQTGQRLDAHCDLFSLGAILYELLTGQLPFGHPKTDGLFSSVAADVLASRRAGVRPIRELNPKIDRRTAEIVERCLRFEPDDRPESAEELARELRRAAAPLARAMAWAVANRKLVTATLTGFVLLSATSGVAWYNRPSSAVRDYRAAVALYETGDLQHALPLIDRAVDADSNYVDAVFLRGRIKQSSNEYRNAITDFQSIADLDKSGRSNACAAYCFANLKQYDNAVAESHQAIQRGYKSARLYSNLAYCLARSANWDDAIESATDAIAIDDESQTAYYVRACALLSKIRANPTPLVEQAAADIQRAIELGPRSKELFFEAACIEYVRVKVNPQHVSLAPMYLADAVQMGMQLEVIHRHPWFKDVELPLLTNVTQLTPRTAEFVADPLSASSALR